MTFSLAILDELARAYGEEIPAEVRAALARIEAANVTRDVASSSPGTVTVARRSKAAERTARWRERRRLAAAGPASTEASPEASQPVTQPSPIVTPVTVRDVTGDAVSQKRVPPTPPLEKTSLPQKGVSRRRRRHAVTVEAAQPPVRPQVFLDEHDARFREIVRMRGKSVPRSGNGWYFDPFEVQQAEERIRATVRQLRPSSLAIEAASGAGPPISVSGRTG